MKFNKENLINAIEKIDKNPDLRNSRSSSTYDLIYNEKKYPPILVLSVANQLNGDKELLLSDFDNKIDIPFKILRDNGFQITKKNLNTRDEFEIWLKEKHSDNSGAPSSYLRSIDLLSDSFYKNNKIDKKTLYEINDIGLLNNLHKEVLKLQKDKNSYIYYSDAPGYGDNNFFSASIKNYIQFLETTKMSTKVKSKESIVNLFNEISLDSGLVFSKNLVLRLIASLTSKPFVILSGLSGSGKTKIAQSFAEWICENDSQYKIVPVGADWTNREPLLGYPNGLNPMEYITPESGVLHLLLEASKEQNQRKPYFIILDEMNLSHVERYFADFLSIMESKDTVKLYTGSDRSSTDGLDITQQIGWPKNVFIIGTVNIDETTYMFSPKVLDRANVIEFRITEEEIAAFLNNPGIPDLSKLSKQGANMAENFLAIAAISDTDKNEELTNKLNLFFSELKKVGAEFGYRTASEIMQLVAKLKALEPTIENNVCLDIAIMQKLLPKLHGSRSKLVKVLIALAALCIDDKQKEEFIKNFENHLKNDFDGIEVKFDISFEKLIRMYKNVLANGFTSYAEA